jgi:hypothetical protein
MQTTVDFDTRIYDEIERDIRRLPKRFQSQFLKDTRRPIRNARRRFKRPPSRLPAHPFKWSFNQAAQMRARLWWFAAIAGRIPGVTINTSGGRYRRSGKLLKNVKLFFDRKKREFILEMPGVGKWVITEDQVPSHARTGWKQIDKQVEQLGNEMADIALMSWDKITDEVLE